ncbi:carbohydrate-binding protein [Streptomyces sp. NPDC096323]|uniref:carbohydrate-binding protein n=1 Tax=Streptomyces sp. NPDC096323 TaxID=3155822 RepID=UPI003331BF42
MRSVPPLPKRATIWLALAALAAGAGLVSVAPAAAAPSQFSVDLSGNTGALRYGATGFLYGLGESGIPDQTMLATLKPKVTAQKAPDGLQHPNGDALKIAPMWKNAGGGDIQVYMQDVYQQWPYENNGLADYLAKVDTMTRKIVADPHRASYVYVPFNEPDGIWYQNNVNALAADWKPVFDKIRSIDPTARIAGPNFSAYDAASMRTFMTRAKANNAVPDVTTWHELGDSFFTDWDAHLADYRDIESDLGLSPRPITINEYGRPSGDLGVPGNLVQFVSRFENSKVDGCLAYWTTAGGLNDLVTQNNRATGAWWLYKWYGELTGHTVPVTLPSSTSSLQAVAALDPDKKQARVIFGGNIQAGGTYDTNVVVKGLASAPYLSGTVHASVWGVDSSGLNPSSGQYLVTEGDFPVSNGQITLPLTGLKGSSAYQAVVTPNSDLTPVASPTRYEAEYAALKGSARVTYGTNTGYSGTYFTEGYGNSTNAGTSFVVTAPADGYYNVGLRYSAGPYAGAPPNRSLRLRLNGADLTDVSLPGTANWNTWNTATTKVFLHAGINQIEANAYASDDRDAANIDYLDVTPTTGIITEYQAESNANTRSGTASAGSNTAASGGQYVGFIGAGAGNTLRFGNVTVPAAGRYRMTVVYANGELGSGASNYNTNIVDRAADISVNGGPAKRSLFRNTLGWSNFRTTVVDVDLAAGANTITFANASAYAPDIDLIRIAAPVG